MKRRRVLGIMGFGGRTSGVRRRCFLFIREVLKTLRLGGLSFWGLGFGAAWKDGFPELGLSKRHSRFWTCSRIFSSSVLAVTTC